MKRHQWRTCFTPLSWKCRSPTHSYPLPSASGRSYHTKAQILGPVTPVTRKGYSLPLVARDEEHSRRRERRFARHLDRPTILFSNNHVLAVHKPPGWHSVPNTRKTRHTSHEQPDPRNSKQCLLTYCQEQNWGGGSQGQFLLPLHRLDQPCSGVLLFGKTSKAASRIQTQWQQIRKIYHCVVHARHIPSLIAASNLLDDTKTREINHDDEMALHGSTDSSTIPHRSVDSSTEYKLSGILLPHPQEQRTVQMEPVLRTGWSTQSVSSDKGQVCSLTWKELPILSSSSSSSSPYVVLQITTHQGRRHMIRALLGQVAMCPVMGDVRYDSGLTKRPLPDQSVALHASRLVLPEQLRLGTSKPLFGASSCRDDDDHEDDDDDHTRASIRSESAHPPAPSLSSPMAGLSLTAPPPRNWNQFFGVELWSSRFMP